MNLRPLVLASMFVAFTPALAHSGGHGAPAAAAAPVVEPVDAGAALATLKAGNARFVAGESTFPHLGQDRRCETTDGGQHPIVSVLSCADSRVPPELIFDAGLGDLFVIRVAGNVAQTDEIGTLEYGAGHLGTRLIVVMGHAKCGAVTAVVKGAEVGPNIAKLVAPIAPAVEDAKAANPGVAESRLVNLSIKANVRRGMRDVLTNSPEIRELVAAGKVKIVGAVYDIHNGTIEWLGEHPEQAALLEAGESHGSAVAKDDASHAAPAKPAPADDGHDAKLASHHPTPTKADAHEDAPPAPRAAAKPAPKANAKPAAQTKPPAKAPDHGGHSDASSHDAHDEQDAHGAKGAHATKDSHATKESHAAKDAHAAADPHATADASSHEAQPTLMQRQGLLLPAAFLVAGSALSGSVVYVMTSRARPAVAAAPEGTTPPAPTTPAESAKH